MQERTRPRRGAPPKGEASARERILDTAVQLFYRDGIRAVGVDTIVEQSGVSKTSLYRVFDSKDALITAVADRQNRAFWAWWDRIEERYAGDPRALLEGLLSGIAVVRFSTSRRNFRLTAIIQVARLRGAIRRKCGPGWQRYSLNSA
jgi:AcrR family transcriptional regulator